MRITSRLMVFLLVASCASIAYAGEAVIEAPLVEAAIEGRYAFRMRAAAASDSSCRSDSTVPLR
jgi:hypothetical protein